MVTVPSIVLTSSVGTSLQHQFSLSHYWLLSFPGLLSPLDAEKTFKEEMESCKKLLEHQLQVYEEEKRALEV